MTTTAMQPLGYLIESTTLGPRAVAHYADVPLRVAKRLPLTAHLGSNPTAVQVLGHATGTGRQAHEAARSGDSLAKAESFALVWADAFAEEFFEDVNPKSAAPCMEVYIHHWQVIKWLSEKGVVF